MLSRPPVGVLKYTTIKAVERRTKNGLLLVLAEGDRPRNRALGLCCLIPYLGFGAWRGPMNIQLKFVAEQLLYEFKWISNDLKLPSQRSALGPNSSLSGSSGTCPQGVRNYTTLLLNLATANSTFTSITIPL